MNYFLFKLQFDTAVHLEGPTLHYRFIPPKKPCGQIPCFLPSAMRPSSSTEKKP